MWPGLRRGLFWEGGSDIVKSRLIRGGTHAETANARADRMHRGIENLALSEPRSKWFPLTQIGTHFIYVGEGIHGLGEGSLLKEMLQG